MYNPHNFPTGWDALNKELGKRERKIIAHNTVAIRDMNEGIEIRYHGHIIGCYFDPIIVKSGHPFLYVTDAGWRTSTTKIRLNNMLAAYKLYIYQHKYQWFLGRLGRQDHKEDWKGYIFLPEGENA
jgi:hypothetical protein